MKNKMITSLIAMITFLLLFACNNNGINNSSVTTYTTTLSGSHCDVISYDFKSNFDSAIDSISWSVDIGTINANGIWFYAPTLADVDITTSVTVTASDTKGNKFIATVNYNFTNEAPIIDCSYAPSNVKAGTATDFYVSATDDCDEVYFSVISGPAGINSKTGLMTINAPAYIDHQTIVVEATDGNASSTCDLEITVQTGSLYQIEIPHIGGQPENFVFQGQHVSVPVNLNTTNVIGGYDLLIAYDNSALSFQSAAAGADLKANSWEYFTYRFGADGNCGNACPSGLLRLVAIAETSNGQYHPTDGSIHELAVIDFLVTNDYTFECQEIPIRFFWMDCGDNALSGWLGNGLHISEVVFDGDANLFPPNGNEIQDPTYGYPTYFGAQDVDCFTDPYKQPIRDISFNNGSVFIACADSIDARGDINLNSVSNEIADAVLYANYFIYGIGVFTVNTEGQIAASDVNTDGLSLSVADLVYLVRIINDDAVPYTNLNPNTATLTNSSGTLSVDKEMGAALVVLEGNVTFELLVANMTTQSNFDGVNTRVLVYSLEGNTFSGDFIHVNGNIISVEFGSAEGATVILTL